MDVPTVSYTEARERLAELWDRALANREPIRLTRRGSEPLVLIAADEYEGLLETAHLLRSPANAERLLATIERAQVGSGTPRPISQLRDDLERADKA